MAFNFVNKTEREATAKEARKALENLLDEGGALTAAQARAVRAWVWDVQSEKTKTDQIAASCARDAAAMNAENDALTKQLVLEEQARMQAEFRAAKWKAVAGKIRGRAARQRRALRSGKR